MLTQDQLQEIRDLLEESQNPLFFFDNDADGLCSFLILQRALGRGKGVPIKSYPTLSGQYIHRIEELNPDSIFVLDKAEMSEEFVAAAIEKNIPITWIDHHKTQTPKELIEKTNYYNTYPSSEPTTYIAQKIFNKQEDLWLAMIGCISDVYQPDFAHTFEKQYPELYNSNITPFEALNTTEVGKFATMLNFGLMNSITNVVKMIKFLTTTKTPYDLLEENNKTKEFHKRYNDLNNELNKLIQKAKKTNQPNNDIIYFSYAGATSMSAIVANRLYFQNPEKLIIVAYKRPEKLNLSIRGKKSLEFTKKILEKIEGATGGGHEEATGAMIPTTQTEEFEKLIKEL
jgi:single-stranded DNA-specific DHH superfamily exonuclease